MIRRSPTRLEFKLEDLQEFDYVHKMDRKRSLLATAGTEEARKLLRQERIGYMNPPVMVAGSRTHLRRNADAVAAAAAASLTSMSTTTAQASTTTPTTAMSSTGGITSTESVIAAAAIAHVPGPLAATGAGAVEPTVSSGAVVFGTAASNHPIIPDPEPEGDGDDSSNMSIDTEDESQDQS